MKKSTNYILTLIVLFSSCNFNSQPTSSTNPVAADSAQSIKIFTSSASITLSSAKTISYLIVAGGGAGGDGNAPGGAGGGGGVVEGSVTLPAGTYSLVVGAGGLAPFIAEDNPGASGEDSSFAGIIAKGGGGGYNSCEGSDGGSGGGGSGPDCSLESGTHIGGLSIQTSPVNGVGHGHNGKTQAGDQYGGGGGGAGSASLNENGGDGFLSSLSGIATYYGGGGGGAGFSDTGADHGGSGGNGGGGTGGFGPGGNVDSNGVSGLTNTGGGGGGSPDATPGNGGSGIIILQY